MKKYIAILALFPSLLLGQTRTVNTGTANNTIVGRANFWPDNKSVIFTATSGTSTGDLAAADDSRIVAGGTALQPAGDGSALTGLTKTQVGLANVDNTSDANKPVSTATQTALDNRVLVLNSASLWTDIGANESIYLGGGETLPFVNTTVAGTTVTNAGTGTLILAAAASGNVTIYPGESVDFDTTDLGGGISSFTVNSRVSISASNITAGTLLGSLVQTSGTANAGVNTQATDAEVQTGTGSKSVVVSALAAWWTWVKTQVQTWTANQTWEGTNNTMNNQTDAGAGSVMTRSLGDARYKNIVVISANTAYANNSTTLTNTGLAITVPNAGKLYAVEVCSSNFSTSNTAGHKFKLNYSGTSATAGIDWVMYRNNSGTLQGATGSNFGTTYSFSVGSDSAGTLVFQSTFIATTTGTVTLQMAQVSAEVAACGLRKGSTIRLTELN